MLQFYAKLAKMVLQNLPFSVLCIYALLLCMCHCWPGSDTAEVLRPRGVSLSKKIFYAPNKDFSCIDGSNTIPFGFVNDDYCDCEDGSDEPGTSACENAVFHCINAGHISENIPSSRVNDNICDCCDGGDEYNSTADCVDICMELGKQAREAAFLQQELFEKGHTLWQQYAVQGKEIKQKNKERLEVLKISEADEEKVKSEKEAIKNEAEDKEKAALSVYKSIKDELVKKQEEAEMLQHQEQERLSAEDAFRHLDLNQDNILTFQELQTFDKFDSNSDGHVSEDEAKFFLHMKDSMGLDEFVITGWMIMKPIYTLRKTSATEQFTEAPVAESYEKPEKKIEEEESDDETYSPEDADSADEDNEMLEDDDDDDAADTAPSFPPKEEPPAPKAEEPEYDEETQRLVDAANEARREFTDAVSKLDKMRDEIKQLQGDIEGDFGHEEEFSVLKGQCFDFDDREYTYRFCPFDKATQIAKSGGSDVNLGRWGIWTGPEEAKYSKMKFGDGQLCWNGPSRSVMVELQCGLENKLLSTSEPNRCEYLFEFSTPALCSLSRNSGKAHEHTEL